MTPEQKAEHQAISALAKAFLDLVPQGTPLRITALAGLSFTCAVAEHSSTRTEIAQLMQAAAAQLVHGGLYAGAPH